MSILHGQKIEISSRNLIHFDKNESDCFFNKENSSHVTTWLTFTKTHGRKCFRCFAPEFFYLKTKYHESKKNEYMLILISHSHFCSLHQNWLLGCASFGKMSCLAGTPSSSVFTHLLVYAKMLHLFLEH